MNGGLRHQQASNFRHSATLPGLCPALLANEVCNTYRVSAELSFFISIVSQLDRKSKGFLRSAMTRPTRMTAKETEIQLHLLLYALILISNNFAHVIQSRLFIAPSLLSALTAGH